MRRHRIAMLLGVLLVVGACATEPRLTTAERLEFYRAHAGDPVRSFASPSHLWGWRALGDRALTVWPRRDRGFLLELAGPCPGLSFATSIGLTTRTGHVTAPFDSILIPRPQGTAGTTSCRIQTIRPLDTRVVREAKRDLHEADTVEREGSATDEPEVEPADAGQDP